MRKANALLGTLALLTACSSNGMSGSDVVGQDASRTDTRLANDVAADIPILSADAPNSSMYWGNPNNNVNLWLGPVTYVPGIPNACAPARASANAYPMLIQQLYGPYIIGLDGQNVPNVANKCDQCAELTANGNRIIAHVVTYGTENGVDACDLSAEARTALGLSDSNWTGSWRLITCPTSAPIYYEFDPGDPTNSWYFRVWVRNSRIPVQQVETQVSGGSWNAAMQQSDGAWQAASGIDYSGGFQFRITGADGRTVTDTIPPGYGTNSFDFNTPIASSSNFF